MAAEKWNEDGRIWEQDHDLLDDEQVEPCIQELAALASKKSGSSLRQPDRRAGPLTH